MNEIHRHYYRDTSAGETFEVRLAAIRGVIVPGSRIADLGCNDGRMALALLASGHASQATGIDLENIVTARDPRFHFVKADLRESGASVAGEADAILCLNVLHHLLLAGPDFVRRFVADLLGRTETLLVDLGSLTERGPWPWRQLMARLWTSDADVADDLFAAAAWRRPLCLYRAQNGVRVLWKLSSRRPLEYVLDVEQRYRRTASQWVESKRLVPVADEHELPPGCSREVIFALLKRHETGERFWSKRYLAPRDAAWRRETERAVSAFVRSREPAASLPIDEREEFGAIYPFDENLFRGQAIHYFQRHLLGHAQRRRFESLMTAIIPAGAFATLPLGVVVDPQAIVTPMGVRFVDFEPSHHYTELVRYLHSATPAQHHEIVSAFWDVNPVLAGGLPAKVRKEIVDALGTDLFSGIVRERLRVQRNRHLRSAAATLTAGRPLATLRSVMNAAQSEAQRLTRKGPAVRTALRALLRHRREREADSTTM